MLFRGRIGLAAVPMVAALTAVVALTVGSILTRQSEERVSALVGRAQAAFPSLDLLRGIDVTNEAAKMAHENEFGDIFANTNTDEMRRVAFVAVQAHNARLEQQGRKADLIAVVGNGGHVVSRDLNIGAMYDEDLKAKYASVGRALDGIANKDIWNLEGHMYRVGSAPIRSRTGQLVGALIIGYVVSAADAEADRQKLGTEVAYFLDGKVHASSFKKEGGQSAEEKQLAAQLLGGSRLAELASTGEMTKAVSVKLGAEDYLAATGPLPGNMKRSKSGFVVLASLSEAKSQSATVQMWILLLGGVALFATLMASSLTTRCFIQPLDKIEGGVTEVINGNHNYTFESPAADFEGLANGLNVMVARLLGRPDPSEDELDDSPSGSRWQGELAMQEATGPHPTPETHALASEPEADYLQRIFSEYVAGRKQNGESTEGMTFDGFTAKLHQNEATLRKKYSCRMVRFKVVVKGNQTTLKPVPIP